jgi:hypothetical protein
MLFGIAQVFSGYDILKNIYNDKNSNSAGRKTCPVRHNPKI